MPDQRGQACAEHDPKTCFCDEAQDRAKGVHRSSGLSNGMGGYECVCGAPTPAYCPEPNLDRRWVRWLRGEAS